MAEMNGRVNGSPCAPPPALCLQIPSLQACTESLPLMLQRPDNFPLVMGILQEINQDKFGFSRCAGTHQSPFGISEVKQENADMEEHHQSLNSEFCEEWSLKGVEELLMEHEDLQLGHVCSPQAHDSDVSHVEVCASDEKPSFALHFSWSGSEQSQLQVDEKPLIQIQVASSLEEQALFQESPSANADEKLRTMEGFSAQQSEEDAHSNPQHAVLAPVQEHAKNKITLHIMHRVKREPEEVAAQIPTFNKKLESVEEQKGSNGGLDACQAVGSIRYNHDEKLMLLGHQSQMQRVQSPEPELNFLMEKRRLLTHNVQRSTSAVLALPADFSEPHPPVLLKEGHVLAEEGKLKSVTSVAEPDFCELTLSLAASKPLVASPPSDGNEDKPVLKPFKGQNKHDGQCQRTIPHQWRRERERCLSHEYHRHFGLDAMPTSTKKQLFSVTDGCCRKQGGKLLEHLGSKDCCNSFLDAKNSQDTVSERNSRQLFPTTVNCDMRSSFSLNKESSRQILQSMCQTIDEVGSPEKGELQETNSPMVMESSQDEMAPQLNEPQRKKMRGTLPPDQKGDGVPKEDKDTRCHRSDGKSWRCIRECINGAYYCQYHLRKRRIGYNRRKNRDVNLDDLEAVSKESLKSSKKSW